MHPHTTGYTRLYRPDYLTIFCGGVLVLAFSLLPWAQINGQVYTGLTLFGQSLSMVLQTGGLLPVLSYPLMGMIALLPVAGLAVGLAIWAKRHDLNAAHYATQRVLLIAISALGYYVLFIVHNNQTRANLARLVDVGFWLSLLALVGLILLNWEALLEIVAALFDLLFAPLQRILGVQRMGYVFVLPNLLIFGIFVLLPMLLNFVFAMTSGQSILPENRTFVGTDNVQTLLTCTDYNNYLTCEEDLFWRSVSNTLIYLSGEIIGIILVALLTALMLNGKIKGRGFFRSVFFYPVLLSPVVVALIWKWLLQTDYGALNAVVVSLGGDRLPFLVDAGWAKFWTIAVNIWATMGFYTLILLAGLQAIPHELYEAGAIDGANAWSKFRFITLPLLRPTLLVVAVLAVIRSVQVFDHVFVLTGGGPGTATKYIVQYIFETAFDNRRFGIAAAASLVLASALLIVTLIQLRVGQRNETA